MNEHGRYLSIDLGEKRIGIAISDSMRMLAKPLTTILRTSRKADMEAYQKLIKENDVILVVMGLPTYLDGTDSDQTRWVRDYTAQLKETINIPVVFQNEALSSKRALDSMIQNGSNRKKRATQIDAVAAAHILQDYLDIHYDPLF